MRILALLWPTIFLVLPLSASWGDEVYFLNKLKDCQIEIYQEKSLRAINPKPFINKVLNVKKIPKKPDYVAFKYQDHIFVTRDFCVIDAHKKDLENKLVGDEYRKKPQELSEREKFNSYKYFAEFETGMVNVLSSDPVVSDYNGVMPNSSTNPTLWQSTGKSDYKAGALLSLGFGFRTSHERFLTFKLRMISGRKSDPVSLYDVNTALSQEGAWTYEDDFKNFYVGYKYIFRDYSAWKPTFGFYLGLSQMSSKMSDGTDKYTLTSLAPAALLEGGVEYHLNSHWGIGGMLGFEYLGSRTLKFRADTGPKFKTKMSYNNQYCSLGVKYYFK